MNCTKVFDLSPISFLITNVGTYLKAESSSTDSSMTQPKAQNLKLPTVIFLQLYYVAGQGIYF